MYTLLDIEITKTKEGKWVPKAVRTLKLDQNYKTLDGNTKRFEVDDDLKNLIDYIKDDQVIACDAQNKRKSLVEINKQFKEFKWLDPIYTLKNTLEVLSLPLKDFLDMAEVKHEAKELLPSNRERLQLIASALFNLKKAEGYIENPLVPEDPTPAQLEHNPNIPNKYQGMFYRFKALQSLFMENITLLPFKTFKTLPKATGTPTNPEEDTNPSKEKDVTTHQVNESEKKEEEWLDKIVAKAEELDPKDFIYSPTESKRLKDELLNNISKAKLITEKITTDIAGPANSKTLEELKIISGKIYSIIRDIENKK